METTHNLGLGILPDISKVQSQFDTLKREVTNVASHMTKANKIMRNDIAKTVNSLKHSNNQIANFKSSINSAGAAMNRTSRNMTKSTGQIVNGINKANSSMTNLKSQVTKTANSAKQIPKNFNKANKALNNFNNAQKKVNKTTQRSTGFFENWTSSFTQSMSIAFKSVVIWGSVTTTIYGSINAFRRMNEVIEEIDEKMTQLNRIMEVNTQQLQYMRNEAADLGVEMGQSIDDVLESMSTWAKQGKSVNETIELTKSALLASNVAWMDAGEAVEYLTAATLQFGIESDKATEIVDRWNEVSKRYATTSNDLAQSIQEAGSAAKASGVSIDELIGLTSALTASTAKSGNRIGNALKTIFSRMTGSGEEGAEALTKVESQLNNVGIALRKSETEFRNVTSVLSDVSTVWDNLNDVQKSNLAYAAAGRRRYSTFIALMENFQMATDATNTSLNSQGSAMKENERAMQSLSKQKQQLKAAAQGLAITLGDTGVRGALKGIIKFGTNTFKVLTTMAKGFDRIKYVLVAGGAITAIVKFSSIAGGLTSIFTALASTINPVTGTIMAITTVVGALSYALGKEKKKTEELISVKETLNKLRNESRFLTAEEFKALNNDMTKYRDLVSNFQNEVQKLENWNFEGSVRTQVNKIRESFEKIQEVNPNLKWDVKADMTTTSMILRNKVLPQLKQMSSEVDNTYDKMLEKSQQTIAYRMQEVSQLVESTQMARREAKELEVNIKRYNNLGKQISKLNKLKESSIKLTKDQTKELERTTNQQQLLFKKLQSQYSGSLGGLKPGDNIGSILSGNVTSLKNIADNEVKRTKNKIDELIKSINGENKVIDKNKEKIKSLQKELTNVDAGKIGLRQNISSRINAIKQENKSYQDMIQSLKQYKKLLEGEITISQYFATTSSENFKVFKAGVYDNLIDPLEKFNKAYDKLVKDFNVSKESLKIQKDIFGLSNLDYNTQLRDLAKNNVSGLINLKAELNVTNIEEQRNKVLNDITKVLSDESITDARKEELITLQEQVKSADNIKQLEADINALIKTRMDMYNNKSATVSMETIAKSFSEINKINLGNMDSMGLSGLEGLNKQASDVKTNIQSMMDGLTNIDTSNFEPDELQRYNNLFLQLQNTLDLVNYKQQVLKDNIESTQLDNLISQEYQSFLENNRTELEKLNGKIKDYQSLLQQAFADRNIDGVRKLQVILKDLNQEYSTKSAIQDANEQLKELDNTIENFNVDKYKGIFNAGEGINEYKNQLSDINSQIRMLEQGMRYANNTNYLKESLKQLGLRKEKIEEIIKVLKDESEEVKSSWIDVFGNTFNSLESGDFDNLGNGVNKVVSNALRDALNDEKLREDIQGLANDLGNAIAGAFGGGKKLSNNITTGLMSGVESYANGNNLGTTILTGIGGLLGGSVGAAIGSGLGGLTTSLLGKSTGINKKSEAEQINKALDEGKRQLKEYGLEVDITKAKWNDAANTVESLFGKKEYRVYDLETAKKDLENMQKIIDRAKQIGSQLKNDIANALTADNYFDYKTAFDNSIGKALQDSLIDAIMSQTFMSNAINQVKEVILQITEDGIITDKEMKTYQQSVKDLNSGRDKAWEMIQTLNNSPIDGIEQNNISNQSFQAGSTTNLTVNNTNILKTTAYNGTEEDARNFVSLVGDYIEEDLRRRGVI